MLLLNFSHPLTPSHVSQIQKLAGQPLEVCLIPVQFDPERSFSDQVEALVNNIGLTSEEWQSIPLLINPPSLNLIAIVLLANLHGRMGYFPPVVRLRIIKDFLPTQFEVAEIINLQAVRDLSRTRR